MESTKEKLERYKPTRTLLECSCGGERKAGYDKSTKQWTFKCFKCSKWFYLPGWIITKETVEEWIHTLVARKVKDLESTGTGLELHLQS